MRPEKTGNAEGQDIIKTLKIKNLKIKTLKIIEIKSILAICSIVMITAAIISGCSKKETPAADVQAVETETEAVSDKAENETTAAETIKETAETESADTAAKTAPAESEADSDSEAAAAEEVTYESKDGWKINYFPNLFELKENDDGDVSLTYMGEASGTNMITVSYHTGRMPSEVLYDKTASVPDERVNRSEGWFASTYPAWTYSREIAPDDKDPNLYRSYTAIEHNGGTLLVDIVFHREKDEEKNMDISDDITGTLDTLEFTNHQPQQEMAYKIGTYTREYKDEIEGEELTFTDTVILNEDHTGVISFQDDIDIIWSSIELIETEGDGRYEYTVEGDNLYVNMNDGGEWISFERVQQ